MVKWRKKVMPLAEWAPFQEQFSELQTNYYEAHPDVAMFCKVLPGDHLSEIYISGPELHVAERLSPDGWEDADKPTGEHLLLLVGSADSWERLGVDLPRQR